MIDKAIDIWFVGKVFAVMEEDILDCSSYLFGTAQIRVRSSM